MGILAFQVQHDEDAVCFGFAEMVSWANLVGDGDKGGCSTL